MSDPQLSITELEDKPDTVYAFGVGSEQPHSVHEWMNDDEFGALWENKFDHAELIVVPGMTGITEVQQTTKSDLKAMLESINTDTEEND